jgi:hypothetical protein
MSQKERHVVEREQPMRQQLAGHEEVAQVRAREAAARVAAALGVERRLIARVPCLLERERAVGREGLAVARVPGGQDAVEHVHAARHRVDEILRLPDSHEIAGLIRREQAGDELGEIVHRGLRLADRHTADP